MNRPLRPLLLAALCWILVALIPATRSGLISARKAAFPTSTRETYGDINAEFQRDAKRRFPKDRRVQLDALASARSILSSADDKEKSKQEIEAAARQFGDDPVAITLLLDFLLHDLNNDRTEGPLSNPGGPGAPPVKGLKPAAPRAEWEKFIALARRGQKIEPNNSYFDWMLLYALFATRRDDEARAALKIAARKSGYDDRSRDMVLNHLATLRLAQNAPLSPLDSYSVYATTSFGQSGKMRQTARWAMESAIADRSAGRHTRALDTAFDILQMGRTMRRQSYSLIGALVASAIESLPLNKFLSPASAIALRPRPTVVTPSPRLPFNQNSLYYYAQNQGRTDIMRFIDRESPELGQWRKLSSVIIDQNWTGNTARQTIVVSAAARFRAMLLRVLPSILLLGALFTLLSRRFRPDADAPTGGFWRGALTAFLLLTLLLAFDAIIIFGQTKGYGDFSLPYLTNEGLLALTPSWATIGLAGATILSAVNAATAWQKRQVEPRLAFKKRVEKTFEAPEDGLMRFDFGGVMSFIAKGTGWLLLFGTFLTLCFNFAEGGLAHSEPGKLGTTLMGVVFAISLVLHLSAWRTKPRRRATLRLSLRFISQSLLGFFVASSVLYALVAFASLPLAFHFERNFQSAMERGEVQIARAKLGL